MKNFDERFVLNENVGDNIICDEHLLRYEFAKKYLKNSSQKSENIVLDIASGSGYGAYSLAMTGVQKVIGVDIDSEAILKASQKYKLDNLEYQQGSALMIPVEDDIIDIVTSFETIEHLQNEKEAGIFLGEIKRVLKEKGILIVSTPNKEVFQEKNPYHLKEYTRKEFDFLIKKYFKYCLFLEQYNAISSVIHNPNKKNKKADFYEFDKAKKTALYFVVICSNTEISNDFFRNNLIANNEKALLKKQNNPILKIADKFYPYYKKLKK